MPQTPPRFVPTLTQVVAPTAQATTRPPLVSSSTPAQQTTAPGPTQLNPETIALQTRQKLLIHMRQHIDLQLNKRIREAVSQLALEHAHKMYEELQPQIEAVVADVVDEAMRQAIAKASVAQTSAAQGAAVVTNAPLKI